MSTPLRIARKKRNWTQIEVAAAIGLHFTHYSRIERGEQGASPEMAERIARHFGHEVTEMQILYPERYQLPDEAKAS